MAKMVRRRKGLIDGLFDHMDEVFDRVFGSDEEVKEDTIRVTLTPKRIEKLLAGGSLKFTVGQDLVIEVVGSRDVVSQSSKNSTVQG